MKQKLIELQAEFERGQRQMAALDQTRDELRDTLLRISGAILVLQELLNADEQDHFGANGVVGAANLSARTLPAEPVGRGEFQG